MIDSSKFYDRISFFYPVIDVFLKSGKEKLFCNINTYPHGRLLEIGAGNGKHFKYYERHDVIGIDTSQKMLSSAREESKDNIHVIRMDGESLSFANEVFDYVVMSHVISVVDNPEKLLEEVHRVLKPTGKVFILNHFTPDNWLRYVDRSVQRIASLFHFKSVFTISGLSAIHKFKLFHEVNAAWWSYFKILIYEKNV
jgi:phosphatidylethanolamine/phosphatidyl-N-methylethanolamine N-methyltransferase